MSENQTQEYSVTEMLLIGAIVPLLTILSLVALDVVNIQSVFVSGDYILLNGVVGIAILLCALMIQTKDWLIEWFSNRE